MSADYSVDEETDFGTEALIPKQSIVYATVRVNKCGVGKIPEITFSEEVFSAPCVVDVENFATRIPLFNLSNEDTQVSIPTVTLVDWLEEPGSNTARVATLSATEVSTRFNKLNELLDVEHLNTEEKDALFPLVREFSDIFHLKGDRLLPNQEFEHEIELKGEQKPLNIKQFKIPFALKPVLGKNIEDLLEKDIIEESTSPCNMPAFVVNKRSTKDGPKKYRMVIDLRRLNDLVVQDAYPLHRIPSSTRFWVSWVGQNTFQY